MTKGPEASRSALFVLRLSLTWERPLAGEAARAGEGARLSPVIASPSRLLRVNSARNPGYLRTLIRRVRRIIEEGAPVGIDRLDEADFLRARPTLDLLFARDCVGERRIERSLQPVKRTGRQLRFLLPSL